MATKTKSDPLARYFKDLNDSDLDSEESGDEQDSNKKSKNNDSSLLSGANKSDNNSSNTSSYLGISREKTSQSLSDSNKSSNTSTTKSKKLPSAQELLDSQSNPHFLNLGKKQEVNWDTSCKKLEEDGSESIPGEYVPNAVPPPSSYEPITDPGIKVVDSQGRKRKLSNDPEDESSPAKTHQDDSRLT